ncbi:MAG: hypothetical protein IPG24_11875 [Leptospiraceae bacterium]|nr:hypothetical protein [Leptospiraceae bacterium]
MLSLQSLTLGAKQWTKLLGIASKTTSANSVGLVLGRFISGMTSGNLQEIQSQVNKTCLSLNMTQTEIKFGLDARNEK